MSSSVSAWQSVPEICFRLCWDEWLEFLWFDFSPPFWSSCFRGEAP